MRNLFDWKCTTDHPTNTHLFVLIAFIALNCESHAILVSGKLPCDFLDSMNISDGKLYLNRTIVYKDLEFPLGQYAKINYTIDNGMERMTVAPYLRGCISNRKPCIRLCCPFGSVQVKSRQCQPNEIASSIKVFSEKYQDALNHNDDTLKIEPVRQFTYIHDYPPCKRLNHKTQYIISAVCILSDEKKYNTFY